MPRPCHSPTPNGADRFHLLLHCLSDAFKQLQSDYEQLRVENERLRKLSPSGEVCGASACSEMAVSNWRQVLKTGEEDAWPSSADLPNETPRLVDPDPAVIFHSVVVSEGGDASSKFTHGDSHPIRKTGLGELSSTNNSQADPSNAPNSPTDVDKRKEKVSLEGDVQNPSVGSSKRDSKKRLRRQTSDGTASVPSQSVREDGGMLSHWMKGASAELDFDSFQDISAARARTVLARAHRSGDILRDASWLQKFVLRPGCLYHIMWDMASILIMFSDFLMTPLAVFGFHHIDLFPAIVWGEAVFWSCDLVQNFFIGYHGGGMMEMRPARIWARYLKGWFFPDMVLVGFDWYFVASDVTSPVSGLVRITKTARLLRMLRMFRLLRLAKLADVFIQLDALVSSRLLGVIVRVLRNITCIVMVNHFIACAFYALSEWRRDAGMNSWTQNLRSDRFDEPPSLLYKYTTALHWALTQFTPASMEVFPCNAWERVFAVCVMVFSVVVFSAMVGSISAAMTQLSDIKANYVKQSELVRRYITEHRVSAELGNRVFAFVRKDQKQREARPILECHLAVLSTLPDNLRFELHTEVYTNTLIIHPFIQRLEWMDHISVISLCHNAMSDLLATRGRSILQNGKRATSMFFYKRGELSYVHGGAVNPVWCSSMSHVRSERVQHLEHGPWFSECALWVLWHYHGDLVAHSMDAEFFVVHSAEFAQVVRQGPGFSFSSAYARIFAAQVVELAPTSANQVDLSSGRAAVSSLVQRASFEVNLAPMRTGSFNNDIGHHSMGVCTSLWDAFQSSALRPWRRSKSHDMSHGALQAA